jgi:hypothetical protein
MADDDWYKPRRTPDWPRQPAPGELLFEFYREPDHSRWLCELRDDGLFGTVALFCQNDELIITRRFERRMGDATRTPREMAIAWAEEKRKAIQGE